MPKRRDPKYSRFKGVDWDKLVQVKKGELPYTIERPAPVEDKALYGCGVIPFGFTPDTTTGAKPHKQTWISFAEVKMANSVLGGTYQTIIGIEDTVDNVTEGPAGWYPAELTVTLVGTADIGTEKTSQLSTRKYKKKKTRSGTFPFGRRTSATTDSQTGQPTTGVADVDYADSLNAIKAAFQDTPATPATAKVLSISPTPEKFLPVASIIRWLSAVPTPGAVTDF